MKFLCECDKTSKAKGGHWASCKAFECKYCIKPREPGRTTCFEHTPVIKCLECDKPRVAFMLLCDEHAELDRQMFLARLKRHSAHQKIKLSLQRYVWDRETRLKKKRKRGVLVG